MDKTLYQTLFVTALSLLPACGSSPPDITGHWVSASVETRPNGSGGNLYLRREFKTAATTSAAQFSFFADAAGAMPTVVVWLSGPYTLSEPWDAVPGSYAGEFKFTELKITPKNQGFVDLLNGSAPGLIHGLLALWESADPRRAPASRPAPSALVSLCFTSVSA